MQMQMRTALALVLVEVGLLLLASVVARSVLRRALAPDDVPRALLHRVAVIDQRHHLLVGVALALCAVGLVLVVVD